MLLYLNERKYLLASIIAIVLDGLIGYFISGYFNKKTGKREYNRITVFAFGEDGAIKQLL